MKGIVITIAVLASAIAANGHARSLVDIDGGGGGVSSAVSRVLQCVPYARQVTGIRIFGDAHTWWKQAEGRYVRGQRPRKGAVMAFRPHANSRLGHVAAVSRIVDDRTVLLRHANWSRPGMIEDDVRAVDVSPGNDWSAVRVWNSPAGRLGTTHWPVTGFIYRPGSQEPQRGLGREGKWRRVDDPIGEIIAAARDKRR